MKYKGDIGQFRKALDECGFGHRYANFYNDNSVEGLKRRRLKCSSATEVFNAPQRTQRKLERKLKEAFGQRWISAYFIKQPFYYGEGMQLCIKLRDL